MGFGKTLYSTKCMGMSLTKRGNWQTSCIKGYANQNPTCYFAWFSCIKELGLKFIDVLQHQVFVLLTTIDGPINSPNASKLTNL